MSSGHQVFVKTGNEYFMQHSLRQPIENSLVLCHLKTLRLYTGLFKFELDLYFTNVHSTSKKYFNIGVDQFYGMYKFVT